MIDISTWITDRPPSFFTFLHTTHFPNRLEKNIGQWLKMRNNFRSLNCQNKMEESSWIKKRIIRWMEDNRGLILTVFGLPLSFIFDLVMQVQILFQFPQITSLYYLTHRSVTGPTVYFCPAHPNMVRECPPFNLRWGQLLSYQVSDGGKHVLYCPRY